MEPNHNSQKEIASLQNELRNYREEKEKIRMIIGQIGGAESNKRDRLLNIAFIAFLVILLACDLVGHFMPAWQMLPSLISLEIGLLMISLKIIWMIHKQAKVEHFQFWILNSIEFRLNEISKRLADADKNKNS
ncbi:MAG: hypothetical protein K8S55_05345 [Phycisphaerae bacterium]|nr:hypothetical protein [Phycisphaerae bacterium]